MAFVSSKPKPKVVRFFVLAKISRGGAIAGELGGYIIRFGPCGREYDIANSDSPFQARCPRASQITIHNSSSLHTAYQPRPHSPSLHRPYPISSQSPPSHPGTIFSPTPHDLRIAE
ncbi:hypothetical protein BC937DRAFT_87488 [Endogone sp. FLAS-F59071]|nr:hypothetical protein BC937DRAFT_87488 [Endogone sp. FLAS-F59071]|eukprot:RUS19433.1 hypothetical protein BC937DRAFT_87488 [Endogone sp. FLAS-F59071]